MSWLTGHMQNPKNHQPMYILSAVLKKGKENPSEVKCKEWKLDLKGFFLSFQRWKMDSTFPEPWIGGFWELGGAGFPHGAAWRWGFGIGKVPAGPTSCCFYSLQQSILPASPRRMSSPWVPTCRYGHRWTRSSISPCCCSWRSAGPLPPPNCRTTARSTPSSPTRGETLADCTVCARWKYFWRNLFRCISEGVGEHARFLPRYHSSALTLHLRSFKPLAGNQVKIDESALTEISTANVELVAVLLRFTSTVICLRGTLRFWTRARKPVIMWNKLRGKGGGGIWYRFWELQEQSCIAFSSAGNLLMTPPRVPCVTVVGQPAVLAPGEESLGVSLVPALLLILVFSHVAL